ncbi:MAG TPA: hypothetical protein VIV11_16110 [Kofleriaceae bacterium]
MRVGVVRNVFVVLAFVACGDESKPRPLLLPPESVEFALPARLLPGPVVQAVAGKGTITEAEVVISPFGVMFEIEIGKIEYTIDVTGKILAKEREGDEPGDDTD